MIGRSQFRHGCHSVNVEQQSDMAWYASRNRIGRCCNRSNNARGVATCYDKLTALVTSDSKTLSLNQAPSVRSSLAYKLSGALSVSPPFVASVGTWSTWRSPRG
jgi:hypothetical protein